MASNVSGSSSTSTQPIDYLGYLNGVTSNSFNPNTVINALLNVQQIPITNNQTLIKNIQTNESIYSSIGTDMQALRAATFSLSLQSTVQANTVASSNTSAVSATANPTVQPGAYTIGVSTLATSTVATSIGSIGKSIDSQAAATPLSALNLSA